MATRSLHNPKRSELNISEEAEQKSSEDSGRRFLPIRSSLESPPSRRRKKSKQKSKRHSEKKQLLHSSQTSSSSHLQKIPRSISLLEKTEEKPLPKEQSLSLLEKEAKEEKRLLPSSDQEESHLQILRREIVEARNLVIKTDNQVKTLNSEVKNLSKFLDQEKKRRAFASASAYVLFAALSFSGLYLFFNFRLESVEAKAQKLEAEKRVLASEVETNTEQKQNAQKTRREIDTVLQNLRDGERQKALKKYQTLDLSSLETLEVKLLQTKIEQEREVLANEFFEKGEALYRAKQYKRAEGVFLALMEIQNDVSQFPEGLYYLGIIHYNLGKFPDALEELSGARKEAPQANWSDDAQYFIASSYEEVKQIEQAKIEYQLYLKQYPKGRYASLVKTKLSTLP